jgi:hypothetical protein
MELFILLLVVIGAVWWFTSVENKAEESGRHPLDGNVTRQEPDLTTIPDGIGHQSITVAPVLTQQLDVPATESTAPKKSRKPRAKKSAE